MRLQSNSFINGGALPAEFAFALPNGEHAPNRNPHLAWTGAPSNTRSFAILCIDPDAPTRPEMAGAPGVEIPVDQPRAEFTHWCLVDIAPSVTEITAGFASDGVTAHGKRAPKGPEGSRQGLNDYTSWFKGSDEMKGDYWGYDGPYPPPNDLRVHRYVFRVYALDVAKLDLPERFTADDVKSAMSGHVLDAADVMATYTLNDKARASLG
ncbi:MAG: YbhB/YbcL family Raf kinase inhibitor-like protein [Polyangiales bacterium]